MVNAQCRILFEESYETAQILDTNGLTLEIELNVFWTQATLISNDKMYS
jgi:hypothetical protein